MIPSYSTDKENTEHKYSLIDDNSLVTVPSQVVFRMCSDRLKCPIHIEVINDDDYLTYSSFLIAARNTKNLPMVLKQGVVNKRTILTGEDQHFIVDIKPEKNFGAKNLLYDANIIIIDDIPSDDSLIILLESSVTISFEPS